MTIKNTIFLFLTITFLWSGHSISYSQNRKAALTLSKLSEEFESLSKKVTPAIVQILVTGYVPTGNGSAVVFTKQRGSGSGVILDPTGYSSHVADVSYLATTVIGVLFTKALERAGLARDKQTGVRIWKSCVTRKIIITKLNRFYHRRSDHPHLAYSGKSK